MRRAEDRVFVVPLGRGLFPAANNYGLMIMLLIMKLTTTTKVREGTYNRFTSVTPFHNKVKHTYC
jgi:hypothetical protein